jgi:hypothetical protein
MWPATCVATSPTKINLLRPAATGHARPRLPEGTTLTKIVGAGITGLLAFVSAVFTTVVESGGFWQYFWLGSCLLFFICAVAFVILASKEGVRIDHAGLSFEPHDTSSVADQKKG